MNELTDYILQFGQLNQQQTDLVVKKAAMLNLQQGEYFSEAGKIARQVGFILEGVIRVCYYTNKGDEVTRYFIDEHNFIVDLTSYDNSIPSSEYIQAVTNCQLIVFSQANWHELSSTIIGWDAIVAKITAKALLQKIQRISPLVAEDATTRYLTFLEKYPKIANRIPLSQLASYLCITQSSLSRIRKNIR